MTLLARFRRLPPRDRRLVVQAMLALPLVRAALCVFRFQHCRRGLMVVARTRTQRANTASAAQVTAHVARLVRAAAQHGTGNRHCLTESLVIWWLLRRRGIYCDIRIGVRKDGGALDAHAWVEWAGLPVEERADVVQTYAPFVKLPAS